VFDAETSLTYFFGEGFMSPNSLQKKMAPLLRKPLKAIVQEVAKAKDMSEIEAQGRDLLYYSLIIANSR